MNQPNADAKKEISETESFKDVSADRGGELKLETCEKRQKGGGWVTTPFIFGSEAAERLAGQGSHANLITFLTQQMHLTDLGGATLINNFSTAGSILPLVGAFVADAYWGRFLAIAVGSVICFLGVSTLTTIAVDKTLTPPQCSIKQADKGECLGPTDLQLVVLYLALGLQSIGTGFIRPCVSPFGASQFDQSVPKEMKQLKHYFNWYYVAITASSLLAATIIVYVQDNVGWGLGFGIPAIIYLVSVVFFFGGVRLYRYNPPRGSPFTRMAQVIVAAIRKRKLKLPDHPSKLYHGRGKEYELRVMGSKNDVDESEELEKPSSDEDEGDRNRGRNDADLTAIRKIIAGGALASARVSGALTPDTVADHEGQLKNAMASNPVNKPIDKPPGKKTEDNFEARKSLAVGPHRMEDDEDGAIVLRHSDQFRFFDKAAIPVAQDWPNLQGKEEVNETTNPWTLCRVQQVEELKCIVRLIPMWITVIPVVMSMSMGGSYGILTVQTMNRRVGNFVIPAASYSVISTITILLWLPFYDKILTPLLRRCTGYETGITFLQKIGVGYIFSILSELVKTLVEHNRREIAVRHGLIRPRDQLPMSAWWVVPQFVFSGLSESFMMVGHLEFFYSMLPEHMTSTGSALFMIALSLGTLMSTLALNIVKKVTEKQGHGGWLVDNINQAHLDYFYALLTALITLSYVLYLFVAHWFRKQLQVKQMILQFS